MLTIGKCPIDINCANARLVAADWFEEQGRSEEAKLLKETGKELFYIHLFGITRISGFANETPLIIKEKKINFKNETD